MTEALSIVRPEWDAPANVQAAATTRAVGFSSGAYRGLNLATHVGDDPEVVVRNRQHLLELIELPDEPRWLDQVHGADVVSAEHVSTPVPADGAWTRTAGVVCAVLTADCLPVLLCDREGRQVAAVHAGWRGQCAGVLEHAVAEFGNNGIAPGELLAWLGPAIGPDSYEVDSAVRDPFLTHQPACAAAFADGRPGHWQLDLYTAARLILGSAGVTAVTSTGYDTYREQQPEFYSYRRDGTCGRQATLIWLT